MYYLHSISDDKCTIVLLSVRNPSLQIWRSVEILSEFITYRNCNSLKPPRAESLHFLWQLKYFTLPSQKQSYLVKIQISDKSLGKDCTHLNSYQHTSQYEL